MSRIPVVFDLPSANRIAEVVRSFRPITGPKPGMPFGNRVRRNPLIFAKITGSTLVGAVYRHTWTEQQRTSTGWQNMPDGYTSSTQNTAIAPDFSQVATNTIVVISLDYLSDDTIIATIVMAGRASSTQQYKITTGISGGIVQAKTWDGTTLGSTAIAIRASSRSQVNEVLTASTVSNVSGVDAQEVIRNPLFPVSLTKVSGSAGDKTTQCSFVYDVKDVSGAITYRTNQTPAFARRAVGKYTQATKGTAYISDAGDVTLWECDEVPATGSGC